MFTAKKAQKISSAYNKNANSDRFVTSLDEILHKVKGNAYKGLHSTICYLDNPSQETLENMCISLEMLGYDTESSWGAGTHENLCSLGITW